MIEVVEFLHYCTISLIVGITSISVGIGEGIIGLAAIDAINTQPEARNEISTTSILGMALVETTAITGLSITAILLMGTLQTEKTIYFGLAELGIALAICLAGATVGIVSSMPSQGACYAIARQPFAGKKILRFMLITQTMIQTPIIFGFVISMFIRNYALVATTLEESLRLMASGLAIGLGSIGPAIGLANFAKTACIGIGINRKSYNQIFSFMLISEAIIETPIIFALIISLALLFLVKATSVVQGIIMLSSALCIGIGTFGPGIGSGKASAAACKQIAINPEHYSKLSKVSMFAQGMIDTAAIYSFIIALSMILIGIK